MSASCPPLATDSAPPHSQGLQMCFGMTSAPPFVRSRSLPFISQPRSRDRSTRSRRRLVPKAFRPLRNLPRLISPAVETALIVNVVPFLWGSYAPAAKILTNMDPSIPLTLLNVFTTGTSLISLYLIRIAQRIPAKQVPFSFSAELGGYLFMGTWLHLRSIALTSASRSAFFIQFSTVFVPLIEFVVGTKVSPAIIPACLLTIAGAAFLVLPSDPTAVDSFFSLFSSFNQGDLLGVATAICYSLHIVRVQRLTTEAGSALPLVEGQVRGQMFFATLWQIILSVYGDETVPAFVNQLPDLSLSECVTMVLGVIWIGVATNALSTWAQVNAQQRVGAARASIFYATQPVWAVVTAVLAGVDTLSLFEIIGGLLIVSASVVVAVADLGAREGQTE